MIAPWHPPPRLHTTQFSIFYYLKGSLHNGRSIVGDGDYQALSIELSRWRYILKNGGHFVSVAVIQLIWILNSLFGEKRSRNPSLKTHT